MSARSIALSPDSIEITLYRRGRYRHHIALVNFRRCVPTQVCSMRGGNGRVGVLPY